ncbi:hypothetical protein [Halobaculum rubrum]|uniref:hypothetical protein n=1 Tax=Halobaculum rubrum TaxID=2872158 RepID=UPI001CA3BBA9|nr:hypothetical protein [Halobaculum rubrum]QZX99559.1 hypothetical protein K6T25_00135 [Halobaculum rubrum]
MKRQASALTTVVFGIAGFAFPERTIDYAKRLVLAGYENPEDLEPSDWYVSLTRWSSLLVAVGALLEFLVSRRDANAERDAGSDDGDDGDGGPDGDE